MTDRTEATKDSMTARLIALVAVSWPAVTIASLAALAQACRYGELGEES